MRKIIQIEILNNLEAVIRKERPKELATPRVASAGGCNRHTKCNEEELPHVRGQGQKPGGPHARRAAAKRSYPTATKSARLRRCRNGREELPKSEIRGSSREELPHARGQGLQLGGAIPPPRSSGFVGAGGLREAIPR